HLPAVLAEDNLQRNGAALDVEASSWCCRFIALDDGPPRSVGAWSLGLLGDVAEVSRRSRWADERGLDQALVSDRHGEEDRKDRPRTRSQFDDEVGPPLHHGDRD